MIIIVIMTNICTDTTEPIHKCLSVFPSCIRTADSLPNIHNCASYLYSQWLHYCHKSWVIGFTLFAALTFAYAFDLICLYRRLHSAHPGAESSCLSRMLLYLKKKTK